MKKILSVLTVSAMAVSMLAACGSSAKTETTKAAETTVAEDKATEATKAAVEAMSGDLSDTKVGICISVLRQLYDFIPYRT